MSAQTKKDNEKTGSAGAAKPKPAKAKEAKEKSGKSPHKKRLRPGALDGLVLSYMGGHEAELPLTATAIGKGIGRSSGAVANCLERLAKADQARLATKTPRAYDLKGTKAR